jgi:Polyketide cyclase / dehydrase and lipid transport
VDDEIPDSQIGEGFHRVEYSVTSKAAVDVCWAVYIDWQNWPLFHPVYGKLEWTHGKPWERGSRLSIEITSPIRFDVEHVIIKFVPKQRIAWLDHSGFITIEQWASFTAVEGGGTRIDTWADIVGPPTFKGLVTLPLFKQFTKKWYNQFAEFCDRLVAETSEGSGEEAPDQVRDQRTGD